MRPAARIGDACIPHCSPFVIMTGNPTVLIEGRPASCIGDHGKRLVWAMCAAGEDGVMVRVRNWSHKSTLSGRLHETER